MVGPVVVAAVVVVFVRVVVVIIVVVVVRSQGPERRALVAALGFDLAGTGAAGVPWSVVEGFLGGRMRRGSLRHLPVFDWFRKISVRFWLVLFRQSERV